MLYECSAATAGILGPRFLIPAHYDLLELFTGVDDVIFWQVLTPNSGFQQNLMQNASLSDHGMMLAMVQDDSITLPMICTLYTCFISHIFTQTQKYTHANAIPSCLVIDIIGWMIKAYDNMYIVFYLQLIVCNDILFITSKENSPWFARWHGRCWQQYLWMVTWMPWCYRRLECHESMDESKNQLTFVDVPFLKICIDVYIVYSLALQSPSIYRYMFLIHINVI